jgi:hypothetical protein
MSTTPIPTFSTGIIPVGIGNLVQLELLYLPHTELSGTCAVPLPLGYGWSRMVRVVIHNNFTRVLTMSLLLSPPSPGVIPAGIENLVRLTSLSLSSTTTVSGT